MTGTYPHAAELEIIFLSFFLSLCFICFCVYESGFEKWQKFKWATACLSRPSIPMLKRSSTSFLKCFIRKMSAFNLKVSKFFLKNYFQKALCAILPRARSWAEGVLSFSIFFFSVLHNRIVFPMERPMQIPWHIENWSHSILIIPLLTTTPTSSYVI